MSKPLPEILADLAAQGVQVDRMGLAYARRAYPALDTLSPEDAYALGFCDGVRAVIRLVPGLASETLDVREVVARLFDPDVLPMPEADGKG